MLLEHWREAKGLKVGVSAQDGRRALQPAALWLHSQEGRTRAKAAELAPQIEPMLKAIQWPGGTAEVSAQPFIELLSAAPGNNKELWERQLLALRVVERLDAKAMEHLRSMLERHPSPAIRQWIDTRAAEAGQEVLISEPGGYELVKIPGGRFRMGSPKAEKDPGSSPGQALDRAGWYDKNSGGKLHPVGEKEPNPSLFGEGMPLSTLVGQPGSHAQRGRGILRVDGQRSFNYYFNSNV